MSEGKVWAHYGCTRCKLDGVDILVTERLNGTGHMDWAVKVIYPAAMEDHKLKSPTCDETFLEIGVRPPDYQPPVIVLQ